MTIHAAFHGIFDKQLAENYKPMVRAMARLTTESRTKNQAVHAVASVAAEHIHDLFNAKENAESSKAFYVAAVEGLTVGAWR